MLTLLSKGVPTNFFLSATLTLSTLTCEYLRNFWKKFEMVLMGYSGLGGNWFIRKTRSKKSRDTVPLIKHFCNCKVWKRPVTYILIWVHNPHEVILHMNTNKTLTHKNYMLKHPLKFCSLTCIFFLKFTIQLLQHAVCECLYVCTVHFHTLRHQYLF